MIMFPTTDTTSPLCSSSTVSRVHLAAAPIGSVTIDVTSIELSKVAIPTSSVTPSPPDGVKGKLDDVSGNVAFDWSVRRRASIIVRALPLLPHRLT